MEFTINCTDIHDFKQLHASLAAALKFPEWYGNNLDALYDILSAISKDTRLIMKDWNKLPLSFRGFKTVMDDVENENEFFYVEYR